MLLRTLFVFGALALHISVVCAQVVVRGTVTDPSGAPLAGAAVLIDPPGTGVATDDRGNFFFGDLPAGDYTLTVSYLGFSDQTLALTLGAREVEVLSLTLRPSSITLEGLEVRATRADARTPMTFQNLEKEELEQQNLGQDAPYLLRWTPSAVVTSDAGAGVGYTGIRIRGTDPTRINITINGIPVNDAESQGVFWVNMPDFLSSAGNVQIQRGVGTSTNGAGAFGATINLSTAESRETAYADLNTSVGSFNTFKRNIRFGTGLMDNGFSFAGRLSRITSDGYIDRASSDLDGFFLSGAYRRGNTLLRANFFSGHEITYQAWNGVPPDLIGNRNTRTFNSAGTEKPGEPYENEVDNYRQTHYQFFLNQQLAPEWALAVGLHYTQGAGFFEQYKADQSLTDYGLPMPAEGEATPDLIRQLWLDNDFYGGVYSLNFRNDRLDFTLGGGLHWYDGRHFGDIIWSENALGLEPVTRYYENDARKADANVYARANYTLGSGWNAYLDLQYRRVAYAFLGYDLDLSLVDQEEQLHFFNPKAGLFYEIAPGRSAYASVAVAHREPNRNDYVESTPASRPDPERLIDTEVGYKLEGERGALEANAYYMYYADQLVLNGRINDVGAFTRVNVDRSYRLGLELSGGYRLLPALELAGSATFSRNRIVAFTEYADVFAADGAYSQQSTDYEDTPLSFSPDILLMGQLNWQPFRNQPWFDGQFLELSWMHKYVGLQYIDNTGDAANVIDPYAFADLRLTYELPTPWVKRVRLSLLVQNMLDALYETNAWSYRFFLGEEEQLLQGFYPQAGRNFLLGLTMEF